MGVIVESIQAGDGKHYRESPAHAAFRPLSVAGRERNSGCSEGERRRVEKGERYALEICCCSESAGQKQSKGGNEGGRERQCHTHATQFPLPASPNPLPSPEHQAPSCFPVITAQNLYTQQNFGDAKANSRDAPCVTLNPTPQR